MTPSQSTFATLEDYAKANVIVTTKSYLRGEPTIPLSHALHTADDLAEHENENPDQP